MMMSLPFVVAVVFVIFAAVGMTFRGAQALFREWRKKRQGREGKSPEWWKGDMHDSRGSTKDRHREKKRLSRMVAGLSKRAESAKNLMFLVQIDEGRIEQEAYRRSPQFVLDKVIGSFNIFLCVAYLSLAQQALQVFDCTRKGEVFLFDSDPSLRCYKDTEHWWMVYGAFAFLPLYVVGIPAFLLWRLLKNRHNLGDVRCAVRYGFLFNKYQPRFVYWEVVVMVRKVFLLLGQIYFTDKTIYSATLCLLVLFVSVLGHIAAAPYTDQTLYAEELFLLSNNFLVLFAGLTFLAGYPSAFEEDIAGWVSAGIVGLGGLFVAVQLYREAVAAILSIQLFSKKAAAKLVELRRKCLDYARRCIAQRYQHACTQWIIRAPESDLTLLHLLFASMRSRNADIQQCFSGVCLSDLAKDTTKRKGRLSEVEESDSPEEGRVKEDHEELGTIEENSFAEKFAGLALSRTSVFGIRFRLAVFEWLYGSKDADFRRLQNVLNILNLYVVEPVDRRATASKGDSRESGPERAAEEVEVRARDGEREGGNESATSEDAGEPGRENEVAIQLDDDGDRGLAAAKIEHDVVEAGDREGARSSEGPSTATCGPAVDRLANNAPSPAEAALLEDGGQLGPEGDRGTASTAPVDASTPSPPVTCVVEYKLPHGQRAAADISASHVVSHDPAQFDEYMVPSLKPDPEPHDSSSHSSAVSGSAESQPTPGQGPPASVVTGCGSGAT